MDSHSDFLNKIRAFDPTKPQDSSLGAFQDLIGRGYTTSKWNNVSGSCKHKPGNICTELHEREWPLSEFISGLAHNAPIFEKSHVGCQCSIVCSAPPELNLPPVTVAYTGIQQ